MLKLCHVPSEEEPQAGQQTPGQPVGKKVPKRGAFSIFGGEFLTLGFAAKT